MSGRSFQIFLSIDVLQTFGGFAAQKRDKGRVVFLKNFWMCLSIRVPCFAEKIEHVSLVVYFVFLRILVQYFAFLKLWQMQRSTRDGCIKDHTSAAKKRRRKEEIIVHLNPKILDYSILICLLYSYNATFAA